VATASSRHKNGHTASVLGWLAVALMTLAAIALLATTFSA
jgi:hypothetical protein